MNIVRCAAGGIEIEDIAAPVVESLARKTGESAAFFIWDGDWISVGAKTDMQDGFHFAEIGFRKHPLNHCFFQAIQPWLSEKDLGKICFTKEVTSLDEIRTLGYVDKIEHIRHPHMGIELTKPTLR